MASWWTLCRTRAAPSAGSRPRAASSCTRTAPGPKEVDESPLRGPARADASVSPSSPVPLPRPSLPHLRIKLVPAVLLARRPRGGGVGRLPRVGGAAGGGEDPPAFTAVPDEVLTVVLSLGGRAA